MSIQPTDAANKASSNNLNRQAALYSLAAAAAGVSLLAMVQPAAGEVVITRKTIPIPLAPRTMQDPVKISIANNGIDNFSFILSSSDATDPGPRELEVGGVSPGQNGAHNQIIAGGSFYRKALALPRGAKIGPSANFSSSPGLVEGTNSGGSTGGGGWFSRGYWGGSPKDRYVGVRFLISGQIHYGWIRLTVTTNTQLNMPTLSAKVTAYAYETVPNKAILAGTAEKPTAEGQVPKNIRNQAGPSLGMLALGANGLALWRREETLSSH